MKIFCHVSYLINNVSILITQFYQFLFLGGELSHVPLVTNKIIPSGFPPPGDLTGDNTRENVVDTATTTGDDNDTIDKTDTGVSNKM